MSFLYLALAAVILAFLLGLRVELMAEKNRQRKKLILGKWLALLVWLGAVLFLMQRGLRLPPFLIIGGLLFIYFVTWLLLRAHRRKEPRVDLNKMKRARATSRS